MKRQERYQIRLQGWLDDSWADWFDRMAFQHETTPEGTQITVITGEVPDQAGLHGLLTVIRDLNLPLLSVMRMDPV